MISFHENLVNALNTILPTHYEMFLTKDTETPCISYMEITNTADAVGDTQEYSTVVYQVKVWGNRIDEIQRYSKEIDVVMRDLGFTRTGATELSDNQSTMIQKILTYGALAHEDFN